VVFDCLLVVLFVFVSPLCVPVSLSLQLYVTVCLIPIWNVIIVHRSVSLNECLSVSVPICSPCVSAWGLCSYRSLFAFPVWLLSLPLCIRARLWLSGSVSVCRGWCCLSNLVPLCLCMFTSLSLLVSLSVVLFNRTQLAHCLFLPLRVCASVSGSLSLTLSLSVCIVLSLMASICLHLSPHLLLWSLGVSPSVVAIDSLCQFLCRFTHFSLLSHPASSNSHHCLVSLLLLLAPFVSVCLP